MKLGLLVIGDGRNDYLAQCMRSIPENISHPITARMMINDEANPSYCTMLDNFYPEWEIVHTHRRGMAGAVQAGFDLALSHDVDAVLWLEEDFTIDRPLPITPAYDILYAREEVAQVLFQRQPLTGEELAGNSVAAGFPDLVSHDTYGTHTHIFSLNPCLIPKRVLLMGWPPDNEAGMTVRLATHGYKFGVWLDGPLVTHIGSTRSAAWRL